MKLKIKDPIIKKVVKKIVGRSKVGQKKYGITLQDDPGSLDDWLNHLQEELMDAVNYIERAREELKRREAATNHLGFFPPVIEDSTDFWRRSYPVTQEQAFRVCNCTMGCPTGKCCQDGLEG